MTEPTNPYEAPRETSEIYAGEPAVVRFAGGRLAIVAIGLLGGLGVVAVLLELDEFFVGGTGPIMTTVFIWVVAALAMIFVMRGSSMDMGWKIFYGTLLGPVASIIYMPVCIGTSAFFIRFVPSIPGSELRSSSLITVILFVGMMLGLATIVRKICQHSEDSKARSG